MNRYETLILASPDITADEAGVLEKEFEQILKKAEGLMRSFERWGKYKLAYQVKKNDYGVYFLVRFELPSKSLSSALSELHDLFIVKYPDLIMRFMNTRLQGEVWTSYQKPDSLEDMPSQDLDSFLRENRMEGLIKPSAESAVKTRDYDSGEYGIREG